MLAFTKNFNPNQFINECARNNFLNFPEFRNYVKT